MNDKMTETMLKQLADLAVKLEKKPDFLKNRIEYAKKSKSDVYFMISWITVKQAEYVLKRLEISV